MPLGNTRPVRQAIDAERLYIFITSDKPDPYVNVLVYALRKFDLKQVCFVSVAEPGYTDEDKSVQTRLRTIVAKIESLLSSLSTGVYPKVGRNGETEVAIDSTSAAMYRTCLDIWESIESTRLVVPWQELDHRLYSYVRDGRGMFDVTGLKKNHLVDVTALLLSRGCTTVFDFEILKKERTFDENDLIHSLKEADNAMKGTFIYRNLTDTPHVRVAERRMVAHSLTLRSLAILTVAIGAITACVLIFFPNTLPSTILLAVSTTAAIVGAAFPLIRS